MSEEELNDWLHHPGTVEFRKQLKQSLKALEAQMLREAHTATDALAMRGFAGRREALEGVLAGVTR